MGKVFAVNIGKQFTLGGEPIRECHPVGMGDFEVCTGVFPTLGDLISTILPNIYILAGLLLFALLLFGGFGIILGAGGGNPEQVGQGKKAVTAAIIGFFLIFASYWIIQIIQKLTGIKIF